MWTKRKMERSTDNSTEDQWIDGSGNLERCEDQLTGLITGATTTAGRNNRTLTRETPTKCGALDVVFTRRKACGVGTDATPKTEGRDKRKSDRTDKPYRSLAELKFA